MIGFLGAAYLWVKAAHLIFVIFWIAGLFMLPRFYVYHQEAPAGSDEEKKWFDRERRLISIIINPAMIIVWIVGLTLAVHIGAFSEPWFHAKLLVVILLSGFHGWSVGYGKKLARGQRSKSGKALRLMNEIPGIAVAVIVILAVVKPF
jgi:putative membrane protein